MAHQFFLSKIQSEIQNYNFQMHLYLDNIRTRQEGSFHWSQETMYGSGILSQEKIQSSNRASWKNKKINLKHLCKL